MAHNQLIRSPVTKWARYEGTPTWAPSTAYALNALVLPNPASPSGYVFQCTTAGTSGATQPTWPTIIGNTVSDGSAVWTCYSTFAIHASELVTLTANLAAAINAVTGGCWAPVNQIVIGGAGGQITGPLVIFGQGGSLRCTTNGAISLNDNDFPLYAGDHPGMQREIQYSCALGLALPNPGAWRCRWSDGGMQSVAPIIDQSDGNGPQPVSLIVPLRCHHGATIASATLNFRIGFAHTSLPSKSPGARVVRVDPSGNVTPLCSTATGADASGWVYATLPGSVAAWTGQQSISLTCDQNNVVDVTRYTYYLEIVEEQGLTGYPWALVFKAPVKLAGSGVAFTSGNPNGLSPIDGGTVNAGDRILLIDDAPIGGYGAIYDGIWVAAAGAWTRATDMQDSTGFSQGHVVPVDQGTLNGGTYWQACSSVTSWTSGTQPPGTAAWNGLSGYQVGYTAVPKAQQNGYWYQVTAISGTGTSASTEPVWPVTVGQTVIDNPGANQVVWTCMGKASTPITYVARPPLDDEAPNLAGTGFFAHGNIFQSVTVNFTGIASAAWQ